MYALLPSSVITPGYTGTPPLTSSPGWDTRQPHGSSSSDRRIVTIYRDSLDTPWGFRLQGGKDFNAPLSVKRVFSGSPADGQLTRDDLILTIDDQPVDDLSSAQVSETIKSAGNSIVLTIETSPYDSAFEPFEPIREITDHQTPVQQTQPTKQETQISDPGWYQSSPPANYETAPPDYIRPATNTYHPKVTTASRNRSANRFQATPGVPYGLSEPGWVPRLKPAVKELQTAARGPPTAVAEPPVSQHRSLQQQAKSPGSNDANWRSQYASVEDSTVPAWYGSLRSTRAAHSWEVRAARTQSPTYEDAPQNVLTEPVVSLQGTWRDAEPNQSQQGRTYKAEIRGLVLSRPAYHQAQSTPEWVNTSEGQDYSTSGQAHSAPETPNADTGGRAIYSDAQAEPYQADDYSQTADGSAPVKIQPSVLFAHRSAIKSVQSPIQTGVILRGQPREINIAPHARQPKDEAKFSDFQFVSAHNLQEQVSAPKVYAGPQVPATTKIIPAHARVTEATRNVPASIPDPERKPTAELVKAPQRVPTKSGIIERFNPVPERSLKGNLIQDQAAHLKSVIERFNPTSDRPEKLKEISASGSHVKITQTPLERFNPTPDKGDRLAKPSVIQSQAKFLPTPVERFNPSPARQEKSAKPSVTQSPSKLPSTPVESVSQQPVRSAQSTISPTSVKLSLSPLERFNPTPDRPQNIVKAKAARTSENILLTPLERFNPTSDPPRPKVQQRNIERFNPVSDRP